MYNDLNLHKQFFFLIQIIYVNVDFKTQFFRYTLEYFLSILCSQFQWIKFSDKINI